MEDIELKIVNLIKQVEGREPDAKGMNKQCYYIDGYALLKHFGIDGEKLRQVIEIQRRLKEKGVNVCTTLGFITAKEERDKELKSGYILQERAEGKPIHKMRDWSIITEQEAEEIRNEYVEKIGQLKGENQAFYDKFVSDWIAIIKSGLKIDSSRTNNFYYEKGKSINFIDLDLQTKSYESIDLYRVCSEMTVVLASANTYFDRQIVPENEARKGINAVLTQIFKKLSNSLEKQGMTREEISEAIKSRFPDIDIKDWREQSLEQTNGASLDQIKRKREQFGTQVNGNALINSAVNATGKTRIEKINEQATILQQDREDRDLTDEEKRERSILIAKEKFKTITPKELLILNELQRRAKMYENRGDKENKNGMGIGQ